MDAQAGGRRVAVTGLGVRRPPAASGATRSGRASSRRSRTGERRIADFDPTPCFDEPQGGQAHRPLRAARARRRRRGARAGGRRSAVDPDRAGRASSAPASAASSTLEEQIVARHEKGARRVSPFLVPMMMANAAAAALSMRYGWQGPCETTVTACAAATHAIGNAAAADRHRAAATPMLAGGSEAAMTDHRHRRLPQHDRAVDVGRVAPVRRRAATAS